MASPPMLHCPLHGVRPRAEFKSLAPVVSPGYPTENTNNVIAVLRHVECGRWIWEISAA